MAKNKFLCIKDVYSQATLYHKGEKIFFTGSTYDKILETKDSIVLRGENGSEYFFRKPTEEDEGYKRFFTLSSVEQVELELDFV